MIIMTRTNIDLLIEKIDDSGYEFTVKDETNLVVRKGNKIINIFINKYNYQIQINKSKQVVENENNVISIIRKH